MKNVVIAIKRTKWERDLMHYGSADAAKQIYKIQNNSYEKIFTSHERQMQSLAGLRELLPDSKVIYREELPFYDFSKAGGVVSLGGDNHFIYVSHFTRALVPIIGVNSDPETSVGALLHFNIDELLQKMNRPIDELCIQTESWTRIEGELVYPGGIITHTGPCTSEISIRNNFPDHTSRYLIRKIGEEKEEQKSSGILLSTGAGSTGWFRNSHWSQSQEDAVFSKESPYFRLIARELGNIRNYRYQFGKVSGEEVLEVISEMNGSVSVDSHEENTYDFPPGCRARFKISDNPLHVVKDITVAE